MKLLTKDLERQLPALYATENVLEEDKIAVVKFFSPIGSATWYGVEYNPEERVFFGYVIGLGEDEWGYFSLTELEGVRLRWGLKIERDKFWTPRPMKEVW